MGNVIVGAILVLCVALIIRSLFRKHKKGKPVTCAACAEHDACPYMAMSEEERFEILNKRKPEGAHEENKSGSFVAKG